MKDRAFWPVFIFRKGRLKELILPSGTNSKTSLKQYEQLPLINLTMIEITHCLK